MDNADASKVVANPGRPHVVLVGGLAEEARHDSLLLFPMPETSSQQLAFSLQRSNAHCSRSMHASVLLSPHQLIVVGGTDGTKALQTTEILNLGTMGFEMGPRLGTKREGCAAVKLDDERMLVVGGFDGSSSLNSTEILNLATGSFSPGPKMGCARWGCAAVKINQQQVMIVGGRVGNGSLQTTEIIDIPTLSCKPGPKLSTPRYGCVAIMVSSKRLLVIGGSSGREHLSLTEELSLEYKSLRFIDGPMLNKRRTFCTAVLTKEDELLVLGGHDGTNPLDCTEVLNLSKGSDGRFLPGPPLDAPRSALTAVFAPSIPPLRSASVEGAVMHSSRSKDKLEAVMRAKSPKPSIITIPDESFGVNDLLTVGAKRNLPQTPPFVLSPDGPAQTTRTMSIFTQQNGAGSRPAPPTPTVPSGGGHSPEDIVPIDPGLADLLIS